MAVPAGLGSPQKRNICYFGLSGPSSSRSVFALVEVTVAFRNFTQALGLYRTYMRAAIIHSVDPRAEP